MDWSNGYRSEVPPQYVYYNTGYSSYQAPPETQEKKKLRACGNGIGLAMLGYIFVSLTAYGVLYMAAASLLSDVLVGFNLYQMPEWVNQAILLGSYILSLAIPFVIYAVAIRIPFSVAFPLRKADLGMTVGGICVGLGVSTVASYISSYIETILGSAGIYIFMPQIETPSDPAAFTIYVILMTVAPALIEELTFRGIVMQSLRRFGDIFALVTSSLLFGIFHMNLMQMPFAFLLGLAMGYFVMRTGSLWVSIGIHFLNNLVSVVLDLCYGAMIYKNFVLLSLTWSLLTLALGGLALALMLMRHQDIFRFETPQCVLSPGKRTRSLLLAPMMVIALLAAAGFTLSYMNFSWL
ncbi:MAG TPA: type II CAAX endopeptidase family protein [Oscillospiraceae bacterium]|nr:type II CAAX endopeptidase family protein [Oscillospiraceae bacterium]HXK77171.1 type II CAAX endopeptidase family protein [Oscillospiraceae bacterium]